MSAVSLFLDLDGIVLTDEERELLRHPFIGGVIFFGRNTESAEQLQALVNEIREIRPELILSMDQEGGRVQRLRGGVTRLPAVKALLQCYREAPDQALHEAEQLAYLMAAELRQLDVDISFAPVLDIDYQRNTVIGDRAFAERSEDVEALSQAYLKGLKRAGMAATGKHFPGHGWADADTHHHAATDSRTLDEIKATDLKPFAAAINTGLEAMMLAHVNFAACDDQPAGFSRFWLQDVLRQQLGFNGFIFSDDLSMKAAAETGGYALRAEKAIQAGCQILLSCNDREGTLDILRYLERSEHEALSDLSGLKGADWQLDEAYLAGAQQLAARLLRANAN